MYGKQLPYINYNILYENCAISCYLPRGEDSFRPCGGNPKKRLTMSFRLIMVIKPLSLKIVAICSDILHF